MLLPFEEVVIRAIMVKQQADAEYERAEHERLRSEGQARSKSVNKR